MKPKPLYLILAAPIVVFLVALVASPIFRTEFIHNVRNMMGYEEQFGNDGLKLAPGEKDDEAYTESGVPVEDAESETAESGSDTTQTDQVATEPPPSETADSPTTSEETAPDGA